LFANKTLLREKREYNMPHKKVSDQHPFLYHYTDWNALNGILNTNELWATHIRSLNDETEYLLAQKLVESRLVPEMKKWLERTIQNDARMRQIVSDLGGVEHQSIDLARSAMLSMYKVTGNDFFVTSFCGTPSRKYEEENGLLSQWRGYGKEQGFLLVFDSAELEAMMLPETQEYSYDMMYLADVVYNDDEKGIRSEFSGELEVLRDFVVSMNEAIAKKTNPPQGSPALLSFISLATRLKHHAFCEEKEVRLVSAVVKHTVQFLAQAAQDNQKLPPQKPIELRASRSGITPFIKLFGKNSKKLPVRKIVVGPGKYKFSVAESLQKGLFGREIEIAVSDIPYV
jgi:hypothetical protein